MTSPFVPANIKCLSSSLAIQRPGFFKGTLNFSFWVCTSNILTVFKYDIVDIDDISWDHTKSLICFSWINHFFSPFFLNPRVLIAPWILTPIIFVSWQIWQHKQRKILEALTSIENQSVEYSGIEPHYPLSPGQIFHPKNHPPACYR
eukprot:UN29095